MRAQSDHYNSCKCGSEHEYVCASITVGFSCVCAHIRSSWMCVLKVFFSLFLFFLQSVQLLCILLFIVVIKFVLFLLPMKYFLFFLFELLCMAIIQVRICINRGWTFLSSQIINYISSTNASYFFYYFFSIFFSLKEIEWIAWQIHYIECNLTDDSK